MAENRPFLKPEHRPAARWVALPQLVVGDPTTWQDVSVRPEGATSGFTVALCSYEILETDFEEGVGPDPNQLLPPGDEFALDPASMNVYLARPFSPAEALFWTEALLAEAGVPVSFLEEVDPDRFYGPLDADDASVLIHTTGGEGGP